MMINKVDNTTVSFPKVTRVEVIGNGREYVKYGVRDVWASVQDDGRTVKIFIDYDEEEKGFKDLL
jgi:hypothetical protein